MQTAFTNICKRMGESTELVFSYPARFTLEPVWIQERETFCKLNLGLEISS